MQDGMFRHKGLSFRQFQQQAAVADVHNLPFKSDSRRDAADFQRDRNRVADPTADDFLHCRCSYADEICLVVRRRESIIWMRTRRERCEWRHDSRMLAARSAANVQTVGALRSEF